MIEKNPMILLILTQTASGPKALREYNTKIAFDPEGKKGGVANVDEARYGWIFGEYMELWSWLSAITGDFYGMMTFYKWGYH